MKVRAAKGLVTKQIRAILSENKTALLSILNSRYESNDQQQQDQLEISDSDCFELTDVQAAYLMGRRAEFELGNVGAHVYLEIAGNKIDPVRLNRSWQKLLLRHEMLRAEFTPDGQQHIISKPPEYSIDVITSTTKAELCHELIKARKRMSMEIFDPYQWPLFEIKFFEFPDQSFRLLFKYDALILDAQSQQLIFKEWETLYNNPEYQLPALTYRFRDFIQQQKTLHHTSPYLKAESYWRNRIDSLPLAPDLTLARKPSSINKPIFDKISRVISSDTWSKLKQIASRYHLTPSGIILSCFADILKIWGKSDHFSINLTLFNRPNIHPEIDKVVGDFSSLSILEIKHDINLNTLQRARLLQQQLWQDLENMHFNGVEVQRALSRHHSRNITIPIVYTSILHQNKNQEHSARRWLGKDIDANYPTPQVWLDFVVTEEDGELELQWNYVRDLFPDKMLDSMIDGCFHLLQYLANDNANWHRQWNNILPSIFNNNWLTALEKFNKTDKKLVSSDLLMHELFENQVRIRPEAIAIKFENQHFTYAELNELANAVSIEVSAQGISAHSLVAVVMQEGWEQIAAVLGILKAGASYLPIDFNTPRRRLEELLKQGNVKMVLVQSHLYQTINWPENISLIYVDTLSPAAQPCPKSRITSDDPAYVIFTSGSTGTPKGVKITHRSAVNTILDINDRFNVCHDDTILALSSLSFDLSVYDIFGILAAGGTIVITPQEDSKNPGSWAKLIDRENISIWNSVPQLMQLLVNFCELNPKYSLQSLRLCLLSGDWIPVSLPGKINQLSSTANIISLGGATEASIWSIYYPISEVRDSWDSIPYGYPLSNQRFYVLDEVMESCPPWVTGELFIGGQGLSTGYWQDPLKTNDRYISHPRTGERIYKTGDLGCYNPEGFIEFQGRCDSQIKIRGYRVEAGEIETHLVEHPDIKQAVVVAQGYKHNAQLIAYIVPDCAEPVCDDLRQFLQQQLPFYMIPESFVEIESIPLSNNGKVNYDALPKAEITHRDLQNEYTAPSTDLEKSLTNIWQDVLGIDLISINDNFFEMGGNSIDAAIIINKIQELLGGIFHLVSIFNHPTISKLSIFMLSEYPELFGNNADNSPETIDNYRVTKIDINNIKAIIRPPSPQVYLNREKNPSAVFILSPPRSGSTLLRVMLQGHPGLFAPPELFLLPYNTIADQFNDFTGHRQSTLESNMRTLMAVHNLSFKKAKEIYDSFIENNQSVQNFYKHIQTALGDTLLVDKTPSYTMHKEILNRCEMLFDNALYIHLTRNPYGMIKSFEESHLEYDWLPYITGNDDILNQIEYTRRQLAEMIWYISHENILDFTRQLPANRHFHIRFEDLLTSPETTSKSICNFLNIPFDTRLLTPYDDSHFRMTDGINTSSRMQGDMKFINHGMIDIKKAESWKQTYMTDFLCTETRSLAQVLGYDMNIMQMQKREVGEI